MIKGLKKEQRKKISMELLNNAAPTGINIPPGRERAREREKVGKQMKRKDKIR